MKLALVTTPWNVPSPVGAITQALVRELADTVPIDVFVEPGREGPDYFGWTTRSAATLHPRDYDQVLFALGDEAQHGFMAPMVRKLGGCVAMLAWRLPRLATAAYPELALGGWKGCWRAVREGGVREARTYRALAQAGAWREKVESGAASRELALNRSVVRFADSFLVADEELRRRILEDRNAPTPIGVVPFESVAAAARVLDLFASFPAPRGARKSLIAVQLARARQRRARV